MPYVNLQVAGPLTRKQKEEIVKEFSETLQRVAGRPPEVTYIVIEEVAKENWAVGGKLLE
ncbi:tautomerase family protein [Leptospira yasudae]|uniref:4-oxalocrotonate tautomerase family protein n=1 Tax=Leptospira yasudae TaxID=2202201 RepID=A0A5F2E977_9LEPT|nr:4-oxalocrotonate tautomerase family protein [Leptospira yasudae]MBW0435939.1 4-oxalocrotonate tautomerase family protein [Leptospira yasudae]TGL82102.1 4-oxalocrotonate tautomerase family protein [Leptospira yasudae]TGL83199.1 4-oxalocrotonate tautomerase family protein [Leptospira yasudae]TGL87459.1 4-oxalocrotonate tautomerase family protein [Leptospira yasudae]TGM96912.1 4-oxalocrotonate tautomerase family protein [Leptospira yasudae]